MAAAIKDTESLLQAGRKRTGERRSGVIEHTFSFYLIRNVHPRAWQVLLGQDCDSWRPLATLTSEKVIMFILEPVW